MKTMAAVALGYFAIRVFHDFMATKNVVPLLLLVSESITLFLVIFSRFTDTRDFSPIPVIATIMGTFYFFAIALTSGVSLIPEKLSAAILIIGICWQNYAKLQFIRMYYEERTLSKNEQYREYKKRVKYRFIPFII